MLQQGKRGSDVVICGNKCDLQGREVAREEGEQLAAELGVPYMETSAKDNLNVEETFGSLASRVRDGQLLFANSGFDGRFSLLIRKLFVPAARDKDWGKISWCCGVDLG